MIPSDFIIIGKIGSTFGIRGWLKITTYTEYGASILDYQPWYLAFPNQEPVAVEIEDGKLHNESVIVKIPHIDTPEAGAKLTGQLIHIKRSQLPTLAKDEFYWSDLEGLEVINTAGESLGKVIYIIDTGSNDVLVVKNGREHAIPFIRGKVILQVDLDKKQIIVDWEPI